MTPRVLCQNMEDSHNRLFFGCCYYQRIWSYVQGKRNVQWPTMSWTDLVIFFAPELRGKSLGTLIIKLAFTGSVYMIWNERNNRIFRHESRPVDVVIKEIIMQVRGRSTTLRKQKFNQANRWLCSEWNLPPSIFIDR